MSGPRDVTFFRDDSTPRTLSGVNDNAQGSGSARTGGNRDVSSSRRLIQLVFTVLHTSESKY